MKKLIKLAVIRDKENRTCPFGLPMPDACKCAGKSINNMTPVMKMKQDYDVDLIEDDEEHNEVVRSNRMVLFYDNEEPAKCPYANNIFANSKIECSFGEDSKGLGNVPLSPIPSYTTYMSSGYSSVPVGFYSEHPTRNQGGGYEPMLSTSFASEENEEKIKK